MKKGPILGLVLSLSMASAHAHHQDAYTDKLSFGLGYSSISSDVATIGGGEISKSKSGLSVLVGYHFNKNWGFELQIQDLGKVNLNGESVNMSSAGIVGYARYPFNERHYVNANIGIHEMTFDRNSTSLNISSDDAETGFSIGVGYEYFLYRELSLFVDYKIYDTNYYDGNAFTLGVRYQF